MNTDAINLASELIAQPSISPNDLDCQKILIKHLSEMGFSIEPMIFGDVKNVWARYGTVGPILAFAGHTDVVPSGPEQSWTFPPFTPTIHDGCLYGRGAADMKTALATMVIATQAFLEKNKQPKGSIAFLITSCEEKTTEDGTKRVMQTLYDRGEKIDYCVVGEASSNQSIADQIKIGRRGSLSGLLKIFGKQGHIAYPHLASNPIHNSLEALHELAKTEWDKGNSHFEPTSFQISNIHAGTGANNVIPGTLEVTFNFRYSSAVTAEALQERFDLILKKYQLDYSIDWSHSGIPFLTETGMLLESAKRAIVEIVGKDPVLSTTGGTSDGRFIAPYGVETIELGFCNETIHQINECIAVDHVEVLKNIYSSLLEKLML